MLPVLEVMGISPSRTVRATRKNTATVAVGDCTPLCPISKPLITSKRKDDSVNGCDYGAKHGITEQSELIGGADWQTF